MTRDIDWVAQRRDGIGIQEEQVGIGGPLRTPVAETEGFELRRLYFDFSTFFSSTSSRRHA